MNHDIMRLTLSRYADGEISAAEQVTVEAHLADCTACRAELAQLESVRSQIRAAADVELHYRFSYDVARSVRRDDNEQMAWEGIEKSAQRAFVILALVVAGFMLLIDREQPQPVSMTEQILTESSDSVTTSMLLKQGDLSKDDVLFSVLSK